MSLRTVRLSIIVTVVLVTISDVYSQNATTMMPADAAVTATDSSANESTTMMAETTTAAWNDSGNSTIPMQTQTPPTWTTMKPPIMMPSSAIRNGNSLPAIVFSMLAFVLIVTQQFNTLN